MRDIEHPVGYGLDVQEMNRRETRERQVRAHQRGAGGFKCTQCGKGTTVLDTRPGEAHVRRRRHCEHCGARFSTVERAEGDTEHERDVTAAARRLILRVLANLPREGA